MRIRNLRKIQALKDNHVKETIRIILVTTCYPLPIVINKGSIIACLIKHFKYPQNGDIKYKIRNWLDIVCDIIFIWFSLIPISISPLPRDHAWMYYRFMLQYIPLYYATKATSHIFGYIASVTFLMPNLCYRWKFYVCMVSLYTASMIISIFKFNIGC